jgi:tetratricopeptide (TPR) repeat protein
LCVLALLSSAPAAPRAQSDLGSIDFPTSGARAAQPAFIRGVLLLHSFEYDDAKESFVEAERLDPGFAMAYWGEAMTVNHPLWAQTAPAQAQAALAKLAPTLAGRLAKAPTQKEKDWLASLEPLYGAGDKLTRDLGYAAALRDMHAKYPDDLEVTAFYALATLGTSETTRDYAIYMRAAALADSVFAKNPKHPGAVHYLIHAFDDPVHAPLGLRYADIYATIAPAASHALHMPAHIYFAMGLWDEAVVMNERSARAADDRVAAKHLGIDDRGFHALLWLTYAYLQQGRYQDARGILNQLESDAVKGGSPRTRSHLALARAAWLVETRHWMDAKPRVGATGLGADAVAADLFAIGYAAAKAGNVAAAREARQQMAAPSGAPSGYAAQPMSGMPMAGAGVGSQVPAVMATELDAVMLFAEGRKDDAVAMARKAAAVEDALSFEFGPPVPAKPAHELLGELLLDAGHPAEAQKEFEIAMKRAPSRALSLLGLFRAATAAKDTTTARRAADDLRRVWHRADADIAELREIR